MRQVRRYSGPKVMQNIDGRTRAGRLLKAKRAELTAHVGGTPSATERGMIDRAAWLALHIALVDERTAAGKPMTECDSRTYLAWSNAYTRLMRHLGLQGARERPPTLAEHIAAHATRGAA